MYCTIILSILNYSVCKCCLHFACFDSISYIILLILQWTKPYMNFKNLLNVLVSYLVETHPLMNTLYNHPVLRETII